MCVCMYVYVHQLKDINIFSFFLHITITTVHTIDALQNYVRAIIAVDFCMFAIYIFLFFLQTCVDYIL